MQGGRTTEQQALSTPAAPTALPREPWRCWFGVLPSPPRLPDGSRDPGEAGNDLLGINPGAGPSAAWHSMRGDSAEQRSPSRRSGCGSLMGENKPRAWVTMWGFSG